MRPGGRLLVDVTDGSVVKNLFNPNSWHEIAEETLVCRQRALQGNMIHARELVIDKQKGLIRDQTFYEILRTIYSLQPVTTRMYPRSILST